VRPPSKTPAFGMAAEGRGSHYLIKQYVKSPKEKPPLFRWGGRVDECTVQATPCALNQASARW
jgi:hypothetical protein